MHFLNDFITLFQTFPVLVKRSAFLFNKKADRTFVVFTVCRLYADGFTDIFIYCIE